MGHHSNATKKFQLKFYYSIHICLHVTLFKVVIYGNIGLEENVFKHHKMIFCILCIFLCELITI